MSGGKKEVVGGLAKAVALVGGQSALARAIGSTQQSVRDWLFRAGLYREMGQPPAEFCGPIERATKGAVTRHELRPDIYDDPGYVAPPPVPPEMIDTLARIEALIARGAEVRVGPRRMRVVLSDDDFSVTLACAAAVWPVYESSGRRLPPDGIVAEIC